MHQFPLSGLAGIGGAGTAAGVTGSLPFSGAAYTTIWVLMLAMLLIALTVMLVRAGRLVTGERVTQAQPFQRGAMSRRR